MSGEWISAAEAYRLIGDASTPYLASRAICCRAHAGLIGTRARRLIVSGFIQDGVEVPEKFWWAEGESALDQNWTTGDFSTWIDERIECRAFGVEFMRSDVIAMLAKKADTHAAPQVSPGNYMPASACLEELKVSFGGDAGRAAEVILANCRAGLVPSRCAKLTWRVTDRYGSETHETESCAVPDWAWEECFIADSAILNWQDGIFAGDGVLDGDRYKATAKGIEFDVGAMVRIERLAHRVPERAKAGDAETTQTIAPLPHPKTRRLSDAWPEWVAELAWIIHEQGISPGAGSQGQEDLINQVADAVAQRGGAGLARTTVQPVVQAVLDRLRAASES